MTNVDDERRWDAARRRGVQPYPETHQQGTVQLHNVDDIRAMLGGDLGEADLGVQIAWDGRVWVCINGRAFLRFKPNHQNQPWVDPWTEQRADGRPRGWAPWPVRFLRWITSPLRGR